MTGWLAYVDVISAGLGFVSAIVLAIPSLRGIGSKRLFEGAARLQQEQAASGHNSSEADKLAQKVGGRQLGGAKEAMICNIVGFSLLALSFLTLLIATLQKDHGPAPAERPAAEAIQRETRALDEQGR